MTFCSGSQKALIWLYCSVNGALDDVHWAPCALCGSGYVGFTRTPLTYTEVYLRCQSEAICCWFLSLLTQHIISPLSVLSLCMIALTPRCPLLTVSQAVFFRHNELNSQPAATTKRQICSIYGIMNHSESRHDSEYSLCGLQGELSILHCTQRAASPRCGNQNGDQKFTNLPVNLHNRLDRVWSVLSAVAALSMWTCQLSRMCEAEWQTGDMNSRAQVQL